MNDSINQDISALQITDWRRNAFHNYAKVRQSSATNPQKAWEKFKTARDELFQAHPQSPLDFKQRQAFGGLQYFDYDPSYRVFGEIESFESDEFLETQLPEGILRTMRVAYIHFKLPQTEEPRRLTLFWIEAYGGGLFLPFGDKTNSESTYGGGRYLYDSIKGADLGMKDSKLILDFNYAYNPSCAYNARWVCPLSLPENRLEHHVLSGEQDFKNS
jgi:hypothetical protein